MHCTGLHCRNHRLADRLGLSDRGYLCTLILKRWYYQTVLGRITSSRSMPTALSMVPGIPVPIQSLMLRDIGQTFPQCASFQDPYSDRKLRSALLWLTSSMSASMEGECVREKW
jgi:hypothetical protein